MFSITARLLVAGKTMGNAAPAKSGVAVRNPESSTLHRGSELNHHDFQSDMFRSTGTHPDHGD